jgi:hypothetical protein
VKLVTAGVIRASDSQVETPTTTPLVGAQLLFVQCQLLRALAKTENPFFYFEPGKKYLPHLALPMAGFVFCPRNKSLLTSPGFEHALHSM